MVMQFYGYNNIILTTNRMKQATPAVNILIATLYLLLIAGIGYVLKLVFKPPGQHCSSSTHKIAQQASDEVKKQPKKAKYNSSNMTKGLSTPLMQEQISPSFILFKSYIMKYCMAATFVNTNKCYLLKEMFIISTISIACSVVNWITLWPIALAITLFGVFFVSMEFFRLPFILDTNTKVQQQNKIVQNPQQINNNQIQIEPGLIVLQPVNQAPGSGHTSTKTDPPSPNESIIIGHSQKFILFISVIAFLTLVFVSQTMFTIYNSVSNLGALNIGSVVCVVLIDQVLVRMGTCVTIIAVSQILQIARNNSISQVPQGVQNQSLVKTNKLAIFQYQIFRNLCQQVLIHKMNQLHDEKGDPSNYDMGASPLKKKTLSPSKVPKANSFDSQTLMNLQGPKNTEIEQKVEESQQVQQQKQIHKSPIKQIQVSVQQSNIFTSAEKQMFGELNENNILNGNKSTNLQNIQRIKINPNKYFSVQRLPKDQIHFQEKIQDDGLVLVQAGLNLVKQKQPKLKPNTIDIEFSPTKKRKKGLGAHPKRRQLIITGSSPYLEYLPDMMKKDKHNKKNMTPSHQQISTVSRKVL